MIVSDDRNPRAVALRRELEPFLGDLPDDLCVVIGGDGFLLHAVRTHGLDLSLIHI